jgi:hypothetical protein
MNRNSEFVDIASVITIGGVLLYSLGFMYWKSYFEVFKIDISFIDFSIDRIIATTWLLIMAIIYFINSKLITLMSNKQEYSISDLLPAYGFIPFVMILHYFTDIKLMILLCLFYLIIYIITLQLLSKFVKRIWERNYFVIIFFMGLYLTSAIYYTTMGTTQGKLIISNYNENVELSLKDSKIIKGMFISLMKNKYFILKKDKNKVDVLIYSENDISNVKIKNNY